MQSIESVSEERRELELLAMMVASRPGPAEPGTPRRGVEAIAAVSAAATATEQVGVANWHGSIPGLMLSAKFRRRVKCSFGLGMPVESQPMTAIASTYVEAQGFAVGADGRRTDQKTGEVVSECARKIFAIENNGIRLVYAWAGATSLFTPNGEFNFLAESANILNTLAIAKPESIGEYVRQFAVIFYHKLKALSLPDGRLTNVRGVFPQEEIARILITGYYDGKPYRTGVTFSQKDLILQRPYQHDLFESPDGFDVFSGSKEVLNQFNPIAAPENLAEAAELVRKYLQACVDSREKHADCAGIGGKVHVATVRPEGIEWVIPPSEA